MPSTACLVTKTGDFCPGTAAVVMTTSLPATVLAMNSCCFL